MEVGREGEKLEVHCFTDTQKTISEVMEWSPPRV